MTTLTERVDEATPVVNGLRLTPGRLKWLLKLHHEGVVKKRDRGPVGYQCMRAGLTEWVYRRRDNGQYLSFDAAKAAFGEDYPNFVGIVGETLTMDGQYAAAKIAMEEA